jgi:uncharacterized membrane protein YqiK
LPEIQRPSQKPEKGQRIAELNDKIVAGQVQQDFLDSEGWKKLQEYLQGRIHMVQNAWWAMDIDKLDNEKIVRSLQAQRPTMRTLVEISTYPAEIIRQATEASKELKAIEAHGGDIKGKEGEKK